MDAQRIDPAVFASADAVLADAVAAGTIPGASYCVRDSAVVHHRYSVGEAEVRPQRRSVSDDTVWDLASLTKVLATTPIAMALVHEGRISPDDHVTQWLTTGPSGVTVGHLLSHSSGLPAWVSFADILGLDQAGGRNTRDAILEYAASMGLEASPGDRYRYSDIGFLALCAILEKAGGAPLDELFLRFVVEPSGVDLRWGWPEAAATEDCPVRERVVVGEVHDLNAWMMGGVSTHAGLFGTAAAVAALGAWQLRAFHGCDSEGLDPATVRRFFGAAGAGSHHWGWDGVSPGGSAGDLWPTDGVGHLAFTGCSIWMAPRQDLVVALCTNRVHPVIEGGAVPDAPMHPRYAAFRVLRPALHTEIVTALVGCSAWPA